MILFWALVAALAVGVGAFVGLPLYRAGAKRLAVAAGATAPALALALYLFLGAPELATPSPSAAGEERARIEAELAALRVAVEAAPRDAAAWRRLASAELAVSDFASAARSFERLIALSPDEPALRSAYGETLVLGRGGVVAREAREAFEAALAGDPADVRARYYLAEAAYQAGRQDEAMAAWGALAEEGAWGASWLPTIAIRLQRAAQMQERSLDSLGLSPEAMASLEAALDLAQAPRRGPSAADVEAAEGMDPDARMAMIEGMVASLAARLEQEPDDIEGWRMLARSYRNLGRDADAVEALAQVRRLAPDDPEALRDYAYGRWLVEVDVGPLSAETVTLLEELLASDEKDPIALLGLADAARAAGNEPQARELLTRLAEDEAAPPAVREEAQRQLGLLGAAE